MSKRTMLTVALGLFLSTPAAFAGEQAQIQSDYRVIKMVPVNPAMKKQAPTARPVALPLAQPIVNPGAPRMTVAQPVATQRLSSTDSAITSNLAGGSFIASAPTRAAIAHAAITSPATLVRRATAPLVVATADDATPVIDDRAAVDNNARLMGNTTYAPATVTQEQAMAALAAEGVEPFSGEVPEQYAGEYAESADCGYYSRSCYRPSYGYGGYYRSSYYRPYYTSYCAPRYYAPAYSYYRPAYYGGYYGGGYCGPRYYGGSYYGGYYRGNGYYVGGYYGSGYRGGYGGFSYGYSNRCGTSWGISIGF